MTDELESDSVVETARLELLREEITQQFEYDYALLVESFRNLESPVEEDIDAFRDSKTALRERLVQDLFSTVEHLEGSDRTVFFGNLYEGILQESYVAQRVAHTVAESFQAKLTKNGQSRGLPAEEHEKFDTQKFEKYVEFVQSLVVLDNLLETAGLDRLRASVLDAEIKLHYAISAGSLIKR